MGSLVRLLALTMAAVFAAACSGPPEPPPGFQRYAGDGYTLAHPAGWREIRTTDEGGAPLVELRGADGPQGAARSQAVVARRDAYTGTMRDQLAQVRLLNQVSGRQVVVDRPADVPGAVEAHRIEAVYDDTAPGGATVRVRIVDVYALTRDGTLLDLAVRAPMVDFDAAGLARVADSLRVDE
ncbi:hypothetical protein SAMN04489712_105194 [Thermomonospora echinospora]|uniref:Lipoprotein n=1 Tax=Thermomonospora echinospora TaxID=1992 RepID=A0A1H6A4W0_9ACTN|nr:hypothetical protein [Thermomonospora echinospora]SEG43402.1 hypothetical protein SAMN04489712_105194 [Thermomonospora echinospora]